MLKKAIYPLLFIYLLVISSLNFLGTYYPISLPHALSWPFSLSSLTSSTIPINFAFNALTAIANPNINTNFIEAADFSIPAVVNIETQVKLPDYYEHSYNDKGYQKDLYGLETVVAHASGVIIDPSGYIVTSNHVIENSSEIMVTLSNRSKYSAKIIDGDPVTDIALIKINAKVPLTNIKYGDSDLLRVGEWVLAVGNPFNLSYTVTAGIVSAKGRKADLIPGESAIESFIQTDAAINSGNSGGALVNLNGELIGINTGIATNTETYVGYSFAVPVNMVQKIVDDLKTGKGVQRACLGAKVQEVTNDKAISLGLNDVRGIFIEDIIPGGSASDVGLQKTDIIIEINGYTVNTRPEYEERMTLFSPKDTIAITFVRNRKQHFMNIPLKSCAQTVVEDFDPYDYLKEHVGAEMINISAIQLRQVGLRNGVKVKQINKGPLRDNTRVNEGFILQKINNITVRSVDDVVEIIKNTSQNDALMLQGVYLDEKRKHKSANYVLDRKVIEDQ